MPYKAMPYKVMPYKTIEVMPYKLKLAKAINSTLHVKAKITQVTSAAEAWECELGPLHKQTNNHRPTNAAAPAYALRTVLLRSALTADVSALRRGGAWGRSEEAARAASDRTMRAAPTCAYCNAQSLPIIPGRGGNGTKHYSNASCCLSCKMCAFPISFEAFWRVPSIPTLPHSFSPSEATTS